MIYILEDDKNICELILYTLQTQHFEAQGFNHPQNFLEAIATQIPQLIILDIMLPHIDGLSLLQTLKKQKSTKQIPIILLTAKNSEFDKVKGLNMGADDYITKPFGVMEMIARVNAILRRTNHISQKTNFTFKELYLDRDSYQVTINQQNIDLTLKEFNLLYLFLCYPDKVFTREQIAIEVWGDDFSSTSRTIDMHINTLRKKLKNYGNLIITMRGIGYKFDTQMLQ